MQHHELETQYFELGGMLPEPASVLSAQEGGSLGPMPLYASPMFGDTTEIFLTVDSSMRVERSFFSVARTTPFVACTRKLQLPELSLAI